MLIEKRKVQKTSFLSAKDDREAGAEDVKMNKQDLKEKVKVYGVMAAVFLPVRLIFFKYVSAYWIGSVGLISAIAIVMYILVQKNKLGQFGVLYQKQVSKLITGKSGRRFIAFSIISLIVLGSSPYLIEKSNTVYSEDKKLYTDFMKFILDNLRTGKSQKFTGEMPFVGKNLPAMQEIERSSSISVGIVNDMTNGWALHFYTVGFVGELELLGLFVFYRVVYTKTPFVIESRN